jgi:hypothetical protein
MSNTVLTRPDVPPPPAPRRRGSIVGAVLVASVGAFLIGTFAARDTTMHRYTYTGTVVAVCSHPTGGIPGCFAITPDAGTAHRDGYYGGRGDVSFGSPPGDAPLPRVGDHVTVTVVSVVDAGAAVTQVAHAPRP